MQRSRYVVLAPALALAALLAGCGSDADKTPSAASWVSAAPSASPSASASASATPSPSVTTAAPEDWSAKTKKLNAALAKVPGSFSVAVLDKKTGQKYAYRGTVSFDTASIVKAQILACMLLHDQAAGHAPTSGEMALAKPMIRLSDNNAATSLFQHVGGRSAVTACNRKLGLTHTAVNSRWGLTKTTANDQIRLLSEFVDTAGPLNAASRKTIYTLMSTVSEAQDWGVPSVAESGETATVKNGWDTRSADGGLWAINTIGRVTDDDVNVSIAVLSHDNKSMSSGVTLVQKVAKLTRQTLGY